jgi:hypothetical protein
MAQRNFAHTMQNMPARAERSKTLAGDPAKKAETVQKTQKF